MMKPGTKFIYPYKSTMLAALTAQNQELLVAKHNLSNVESGKIDMRPLRQAVDGARRRAAVISSIIESHDYWERINERA